MQHTANDVVEMKRLSSLNLITESSVLIMESYPSFQGTNFGRASENGSPHRTLRRTTTSHVVPIRRSRRPGFLKAVYFRSGSQQDRFFGFTENVCHVSKFLTRFPLIISCVVAGSGKSIIWFVYFFIDSYQR